MIYTLPLITLALVLGSCNAQSWATWDDGSKDVAVTVTVRNTHTYCPCQDFADPTTWNDWSDIASATSRSGYTNSKPESLSPMPRHTSTWTKTTAFNFLNTTTTTIPYTTPSSSSSITNLTTTWNTTTSTTTSLSSSTTSGSNTSSSSTSTTSQTSAPSSSTTSSQTTSSTLTTSSSLSTSSTTSAPSTTSTLSTTSSPSTTTSTLSTTSSLSTTTSTTTTSFTTTTTSAACTIAPVKTYCIDGGYFSDGAKIFQEHCGKGLSGGSSYSWAPQYEDVTGFDQCTDYCAGQAACVATAVDYNGDQCIIFTDISDSSLVSSGWDLAIALDFNPCSASSTSTTSSTTPATTSSTLSSTTTSIISSTTSIASSITSTTSSTASTTSSTTSTDSSTMSTTSSTASTTSSTTSITSSTTSTTSFITTPSTTSSTSSTTSQAPLPTCSNIVADGSFESFYPITSPVTNFNRNGWTFSGAGAWINSNDQFGYAVTPYGKALAFFESTSTEVDSIAQIVTVSSTTLPYFFAYHYSIFELEYASCTITATYAGVPIDTLIIAAGQSNPSSLTYHERLIYFTPSALTGDLKLTSTCTFTADFAGQLEDNNDPEAWIFIDGWSLQTQGSDNDCQLWTVPPS